MWASPQDISKVSTSAGKPGDEGCFIGTSTFSRLWTGVHEEPTWGMWVGGIRCTCSSQCRRCFLYQCLQVSLIYHHHPLIIHRLETGDVFHFSELAIQRTSHATAIRWTGYMPVFPIPSNWRSRFLEWVFLRTWGPFSLTSSNLLGPVSILLNVFFRRLHCDYRHGTWPMCL